MSKKWLISILIVILSSCSTPSRNKIKREVAAKNTNEKISAIFEKAEESIKEEEDWGPAGKKFAVELMKTDIDTQLQTYKYFLHLCDEGYDLCNSFTLREMFDEFDRIAFDNDDVYNFRVTILMQADIINPSFSDIEYVMTKIDSPNRIEPLKRFYSNAQNPLTNDYISPEKLEKINELANLYSAQTKKILSDAKSNYCPSILQSFIQSRASLK